MIRRNAWQLWVGVVTLIMGLGACTQQQDQSTASAIEYKTFALAPAIAPVKAAFLTGQLQDLKVTERVEQGTGKVVDPPKLRATLKLKNVSQDRSVRLLSARIGYLDAEGKLIALAEGREDTSFKFYAYATDRLDPGMETSQDIEVPFPAAALKEKRLRDIRLELSYIPTPYTEETINIPASLAE